MNTKEAVPPALLLFSLALFAMAFISPAWRRDPLAVKNSWDGLWYSCYALSNSGNEKFVSVQVMMAFAFASYAAAVGLLFLKLCGIITEPNKKAQIALTCIYFLAATFNVIGLIIYGSEYGKDVHWSFGLAAVAGALTFVGGVAAAMQRN